MSDQPDSDDLRALTTKIIVAHVANNTITPRNLPKLIHGVHQALATVAAAHDKPRPVVAVKKSITPDYIICLEDGKRLKMLKRHLMTSFGLTPQAYRERWGLPADYPMVAPKYAAQRSALAKKIGLGTKSRRRRRRRKA